MCNRPNGGKETSEFVSGYSGSSSGAGGVASPRPSRKITSDRALRIGLGQQLPFAPRGVRVGATQHRVRELLAELHAGLIEGVDAVQPTSVGRGELQEHEQPAHVEWVHPIE